MSGWITSESASTGGKTRHGGVSKMGQSDIRKLLIVGAMSRIRWIVEIPAKGRKKPKWSGKSR
jgi:transposase